MHSLPAHDAGKPFDWGKTSLDYATFRPGPPLSFYQRLAAWDIGMPGQRLLDLGTGTGVLARQFAQQGAVVDGIDPAEPQIVAARELAKRENVSVQFHVAPAERLPLADHTFDIATANQCWLYFDKAKALNELRRVLRPGGLLVTSHFSWLPRLDEVARRTEELVLKHNPQWSAGDWPGVIPPCPPWAEHECVLRGMFFYDEPIPFTRESWRGRIRACRGVGATMSPAEVERFDREHAKLLETTVDETFTVLHRIDAHVFDVRSPS